jgi:hypothetical protein
LLPTFLLAGAAKAGTTSLWHHLQAHPEVCMATIKEPRFFTRMVGDGSPAHQEQALYAGHYDLGIDWYRGLFQHCGQAKAIGEASTAYLTAPDAPDLITQTLNPVKLIFILRDPVQRLYSNYWQDVKSGYPRPSFKDMLSGHASLSGYKDNSRYEGHLPRFFDRFGADQVSIFLFEDLVSQPRMLLRDVYRAVGVNSEFVPNDVTLKGNAPRQARWQPLQNIIRMLTVWSMQRVSHPGLYQFMSRQRARLMGLVTRPDENPPIEPEFRRQLVAEFEPTINYVEALVKRPLPAWREKSG